MASKVILQPSQSTYIVPARLDENQKPIAGVASDVRLTDVARALADQFDIEPDKAWHLLQSQNPGVGNRLNADQVVHIDTSGLTPKADVGSTQPTLPESYEPFIADLERRIKEAKADPAPPSANDAQALSLAQTLLTQLKDVETLRQQIVATLKKDTSFVQQETNLLSRAEKEKFSKEVNERGARMGVLVAQHDQLAASIAQIQNQINALMTPKSIGQKIEELQASQAALAKVMSVATVEQKATMQVVNNTIDDALKRLKAGEDVDISWLSAPPVSPQTRDALVQATLTAQTSEPKAEDKARNIGFSYTASGTHTEKIENTPDKVPLYVSLEDWNAMKKAVNAGGKMKLFEVGKYVSAEEANRWTTEREKNSTSEALGIISNLRAQ